MVSLHIDPVFLTFFFSLSQGKIWVSTDAGSTTSIDSTMTDDIRRGKYDLDVSMDR